MYPMACAIAALQPYSMRGWPCQTMTQPCQRSWHASLFWPWVELGENIITSLDRSKLFIRVLRNEYNWLKKILGHLALSQAQKWSWRWSRWRQHWRPPKHRGCQPLHDDHFAPKQFGSIFDTKVGFSTPLTGVHCNGTNTGNLMVHHVSSMNSLKTIFWFPTRWR